LPEKKLLLLEDNCDALGSDMVNKKLVVLVCLLVSLFIHPTFNKWAKAEQFYTMINGLTNCQIIARLGTRLLVPGDEKRTLGACGVRFSHKSTTNPMI
jgi:hypothetical protein